MAKVDTTKKPSEMTYAQKVSSDTYLKQNRQTICRMYEAKGKCKFDDKCGWLHIDKITGKYLKTLYTSNETPITNTKNTVNDNNNETSKKTDVKQTKISNDDDEKVNEKKNDQTQKEEKKEEKEEKVDEQALAMKFKKLMMRKIVQSEQEQSKNENNAKNIQKSINNNYNNNNNNKGNVATNDANKANNNANNANNKANTANNNNNNNNANANDNNTNKVSKVAKVTKTNYGSYGTTSDEYNVCWEFNTMSGCRKGQSCKWNHLYLMRQTNHPFTGERLNGIKVKNYRMKYGL